VNPLRKVPALIIDDGMLVDSTVICEYLDALAGGGHLIPLSGPERWRVLAAHAVAQGMTDAVIGALRDLVAAGAVALGRLDRRSVGQGLDWSALV